MMDERAKKISATMKGKRPKNLDLLHSPESREKARKSMLGRKISEEHKRKIGLANKGKKRSEEIRKMISKNGIGRKVSELTRLKKSKIAKERGYGKWMKGRNKGEKSPLWRGGKMSEYPELIRIRKSNEYYWWRKTIFEMYDFTCRRCLQRGGALEAHHINNFVDFPELRFSLENGIVFCKKCHREFHKKYGMFNNNKNQVDIFIL